MALIVVPIICCVVYFTAFLGNWSPIHCRISVSIIGLLCIALSVLAGRGLCYYFGMENMDLHESVPFLMLGIGIDDIFILCNALDQVSLKLPPAKRI